MPLVPMVIKRSHDGERSMDLYSRLLDERIIMVTEPVDSDMASIIVGQLLYLASEDSTKDITMYINTPGGSVTSMWSIIDAMNLVKPDVSTIVIGMAASAGSLILANGAKGKRMALPHAEVMIHQPSINSIGGQASDVEIAARNILKTKRLGAQFIADKTGQTFERVERDMDRDNYLSAEEAIEYGIIDRIIDSKLETTKK